MKTSATDTRKRYKCFLNDWREYCLEKIPVAQTALRDQYGVASYFPTFCISQEKLFWVEKEVKKVPLWNTRHEDEFTDAMVDSIRIRYNSYITNKRKKQPSTLKQETVLVPTNKSQEEIRIFPTRVLINELKRRGYSGTISHSINF